MYNWRRFFCPHLQFFFFFFFISNSQYQFFSINNCLFRRALSDFYLFIYGHKSFDIKCIYSIKLDISSWSFREKYLSFFFHLKFKWFEFGPNHALTLCLFEIYTFIYVEKYPLTYRCKHLIIGRFIARFHETASTTIFDTIVENLLTFSRIHKHFCVCQYKQRTRNSLVDDNESISFRHLRRRRLFEIEPNRKTIPHLDRWFSPNESNRWRKKKKENHC